jgi:hypothetical protein
LNSAENKLRNTHENIPGPRCWPDNPDQKGTHAAGTLKPG